MSASDLALGPEGNLWFPLDGYEKPGEIGRMTPRGRVITFPLPASGSAKSSPTTLEAIALGPDRHLWFTASGGGGARIGRVSPTGKFRVFPLAHPRRFPNAIAAGNHGNLWFTMVGQGLSGQGIGRITTSGQISEFPLPANEFANGIIAGADGNMWFLAEGSVRKWPPAGLVGRITPSGKISQFRVPGSQGNSGIASAHGDIWFGVEPEESISAAEIGRITPTGRISLYPLPAPSGLTGGVNSLVAVPGGDLWFLGNDPQVIGRVTPDGEVSRMLLGAEASGHFGLVMSADGDLWSTGAKGLLRVTPKFIGTEVRQLGGLTTSGPVRVELRCRRGGLPCRGFVRLSRQRTQGCCGPVAVVSAPYDVAPGMRKVVSVRVGALQREALRRAKRNGHFVTVAAFETGGAASSRLLVIRPLWRICGAI